MTALITHRPLQELSMSAIQSGSRRLSARLHEKDISQTQHRAGTGTTNAAKGKKRKNDYDEEDDGFAFSRVKKNKKLRQSSEHEDKIAVRVPLAPPAQREVRKKPSSDKKTITEHETAAAVAKNDRRKRMSFSTPAREQPVRRSKRLSTEKEERNGSPAPPNYTAKTSKPPREKTLGENTRRIDLKSPAKQVQNLQSGQPTKLTQIAQPTPAPVEDLVNEETLTKDIEPVVNPEEQHSSTKISLPFADTPVIRRNKAMREGRGSKGDRRSSLGLRGRRASSLIETGNSNALPHKEVEIGEFYKHIESDMMEPRRMKQLLTWCATRAMHSKPKGTDTNESGPISAARIIEEELLKEIVNKSELSDWFRREDTAAPIEPLPEKPHPKNIQNAEKIAQLEEQIQRLRIEKDALEALLRQPEIQTVEATSTNPSSEDIDQHLLSDDDAAFLRSLESSADLSVLIPQRITALTSSLGPAIDTFTDGLHKIAQYRNAADNVASRVLAMCADKISEREREGRKRALHISDDRSPGRDLSNVLRGLSKADR